MSSVEHPLPSDLLQQPPPFRSDYGRKKIKEIPGDMVRKAAESRSDFDYWNKLAENPSIEGSESSEQDAMRHIEVDAKTVRAHARAMLYWIKRAYMTTAQYGEHKQIAQSIASDCGIAEQDALQLMQDTEAELRDQVGRIRDPNRRRQKS